MNLIFALDCQVFVSSIENAVLNNFRGRGAYCLLSQLACIDGKIAAYQYSNSTLTC